MKTRAATFSGAIAAIVVPAATFGIGGAAAEGGTIVPLESKLHRCDFSLVTTKVGVPFVPLATATATIHRSGSSAVAEVSMWDQPQPGTHFDVSLIQEPRPGGAGCGPGNPGIAFAGLDTDGGGRGSTTVQDALQPGTTGVWVIVSRPNPNSQNPAEFYTSDFLAPV